MLPPAAVKGRRAGLAGPTNLRDAVAGSCAGSVAAAKGAALDVQAAREGLYIRAAMVMAFVAVLLGVFSVYMGVSRG